MTLGQVELTTNNKAPGEREINISNASVMRISRKPPGLQLRKNKLLSDWLDSSCILIVANSPNTISIFISSAESCLRFVSQKVFFVMYEFDNFG